MHMTTSLKRYIEEHLTTLRLAETFLRQAQAKGTPTRLGDVAYHVAKKTQYEVMEWQARAIVSHAMKRGAFGSAKAVPGVGIVFGRSTLRLVKGQVKGQKRKAA